MTERMQFTGCMALFGREEWLFGQQMGSVFIYMNTPITYPASLQEHILQVTNTTVLFKQGTQHLPSIYASL